MNTDRPDILIFLSDQHTSLYTSPWGGPAQAKTLEYLCQNGTSFTEAYTSCPLCVPARMSMLSCLLPSKTGILTNRDTLADTTPTFLHSLAASGYETVLIGRMHFIGQDQRHGFTKRIGKDITPVGYARPEAELKQERGVFYNTFEMPGSIDAVGGGNSPVLAYDRYIAKTAENYLSLSHSKPQCIVVGTYAPHFPYVCPHNLYEKYKNQFKNLSFSSAALNFCPLTEKRRKFLSDDDKRCILAAYCGMIEFTDSLIRRIYQSFLCFVKKRQTKHLFCYISDHGDQAGEKDFYGKFTFFEKSVKIPLIFSGDGIPKNQNFHIPVGIMDLGPTILDYTHTSSLYEHDGLSLMPLIAGKKTDSNYFDRMIVSEIAEEKDGCYYLGRMGRIKNYKFITYHHFETYDMLFDLSSDPGETKNIAAQYPEITDFFKKALSKYPDAGCTEHLLKIHDFNYCLFEAYEKAAGITVKERWQDNPEDAKIIPCK